MEFYSIERHTLLRKQLSCIIYMNIIKNICIVSNNSVQCMNKNNNTNMTVYSEKINSNQNCAYLEIFLRLYENSVIH